MNRNSTSWRLLPDRPVRLSGRWAANRMPKKTSLKPTPGTIWNHVAGLTVGWDYSRRPGRQPDRGHRQHPPGCDRREL